MVAKGFVTTTNSRSSLQSNPRLCNIIYYTLKYLVKEWDFCSRYRHQGQLQASESRPLTFQVKWHINDRALVAVLTAPVEQSGLDQPGPLIVQ